MIPIVDWLMLDNEWQREPPLDFLHDTVEVNHGWITQIIHSFINPKMCRSFEIILFRTRNSCLNSCLSFTITCTLHGSFKTRGAIKYTLKIPRMPTWKWTLKTYSVIDIIDGFLFATFRRTERQRISNTEFSDSISQLAESIFIGLQQLKTHCNGNSLIDGLLSYVRRMSSVRS